MSEVSAREKAQCAKRELAMRRRVYPALVRRGKMSQPQAIHELRVMEAIAADYERAADASGEPEGDLL